MTCKETNPWGERLFQVALILVGVFIAKGTDFIGEKRLVDSDVRAHLLAATILGHEMQFKVALINAGNRQGLISEVSLQTPVVLQMEGQAFTSIKDSEPSSDVVPLILAPGEVKLLTLYGKVPTIDGSVSAQSNPGEVPKAGGKTTADKGTEVHAVIRALRFRGKKYEARWKLCSIDYASDNSARWSPGIERVNVFESVHLAEDKNWLSHEFMIKHGSRANREGDVATPEAANGQ